MATNLQPRFETKSIVGKDSPRLSLGPRGESAFRWNQTGYELYVLYTVEP